MLRWVIPFLEKPTLSSESTYFGEQPLIGTYVTDKIKTTNWDEIKITKIGKSYFSLILRGRRKVRHPAGRGAQLVLYSTSIHSTLEACLRVFGS